MFKTFLFCSYLFYTYDYQFFEESGNPDGLPALYSGIRTGLALENHLIYRPPLVRDGTEVQPALRTSIYDSNWLNGSEGHVWLSNFQGNLHEL